MSFEYKIIQDELPLSPRDEFDNLGTITYWHRRYVLGDEDGDKNYGSPHDFSEEVLGDAIWLPVYLYDHSGQTISTRPFLCPWDSGQIGFIWVSKDAVRKEFGVKRISPKLRKKVEYILRNEIHIFDCYLQGECYGFEIVKLLDDGSKEAVDSCFGFYGTDAVEQSAQEALDFFETEAA